MSWHERAWEGVVGAASWPIAVAALLGLGVVAMAAALRRRRVP